MTLNCCKFEFSRNITWFRRFRRQQRLNEWRQTYGTVAGAFLQTQAWRSSASTSAPQRHLCETDKLKPSLAGGTRPARLDVSLWVPHKCCWGADLDADGHHAWVRRKEPGRTNRHRALNDVIWSRCLSTLLVFQPHQRTVRFVWRQAARWALTGSLATWKVPGLGCNVVCRW